MTDGNLIFWIVICGLGVVVLFIVTKHETAHAEEIERKQSEKIKQRQIEEYNNTHTEDGQVKCPSCGSTQIQLVARNWSFLTGVFTNKVDRICISCMNKF